MARLKTEIDVKLARIAADRERAQLKSRTIVWCYLISAGVACVGIIAWAAVRITDKPDWLVLALAMIGVGGTPSLVAWRLHWRLKRLDASIKADVSEEIAEPSSVTGRSVEGETIE